MLEDDQDVSGRVELAVGPWKMSGTILRRGVSDGSTVTRVKGGAGGMTNSIGPQAYVNPTFSIPLGDIVSKSGEALAGSSDKTLLQTSLNAFHFQETTCGHAIGQLCEAMDANWRILPSGLLWVGFESWPEVSVGAEIVSASPHLNRMTVSVQAPVILPGNKLYGRKVSRVEYQLEEGMGLDASVVFHGD